jgi:murein L,D-transpeptidase YcbB/YkuD
MNPSWSKFSCFLFFIGAGFIISCKETEKPKEKDIVEKPEEINIRIKKNLQQTIAYAVDNKGRVNDSIRLEEVGMVNAIYDKHQFAPLWSSDEKWSPLADSLFGFIEQSRFYGLFPSDYHYRSLAGIRSSIVSDTVSAKNAALWGRADLMFTDALILISRHLKRGRLDFDSVTLRTDTIIPEEFYLNLADQVLETRELRGHLHELEPKLGGYDSIKTGLRHFLDSVNFKRYTYLPYPGRDTAQFLKLLQLRFFEGDYLPSATEAIDTAKWRETIAAYQKQQGLRVTGKINEVTINSLNNTDWEKFKRAAITLDRYKLLPDSMPPIYIWVNIPAFAMRVVEADSTVFESRIIVGTTKTRTPLLTSQLSNFITYPQWTVPYSIIFKEMLPQIQKNVDYLRKQNLMVVDKNDSIIDPYTIDWKKLSKSRFPYLLKQRQGDDNSLGVLKFNFQNKYSVYLHDTNARWLFSRADRALSHGCVRVKEFEKLANFLVRHDTIRYHPDTIKSWIKRQEKHVVSGFPRVPVFIRYFGCESQNRRLKFYPDIYGEDRVLRNRYFADKSLP